MIVDKPRRPRSHRATAASLCLAGFLSALLAAGAVIPAAAASNRDQSPLRQLDLELIAATRAGYSEAELAPIVAGETQLALAPAPAWPGDRPAFAQHRAQRVAELRAALRGLELNRVQLLRRTAEARLGELSEGLARDARLGVESSDLRPLQDSAAVAAARLPLAQTPADYSSLLGDLLPTLSAVAELNAQQAAQLALVEGEAASLKDRGPAAARRIGLEALAGGRNDASIAAFMNRPDLNQSEVGLALRHLESTAPRLDSADPAEVALAAALLESYRDRIHAALLRAMPPKLIVTSLAAQEMWVYWNGQLWLDTLVTTGRPALPTDVGLMVVARKESPVHMVSPFPKGSLYDYGTVDTKYALWFQPSGEAIHDSWWRSWYGPASNQGDLGSHGCIGLPYGPIDRLYAWTDVGTPVIVVPGDGSPVAAQLARKTYDDPWWSYHALGTWQSPPVASASS